MALFYHEPVLVEEVLHYWITDPKGRYLDCTLGGGGHTYALLSQFPEATVIGLDRDPDALEAAEERLHEFRSRVVLVQSNFGDLERVVEEAGGPSPVVCMVEDVQ